MRQKGVTADMKKHILAPINCKEMKLGYLCDVAYHTFAFHAHEAYEILYFQKGAVQYYLEDKAYSLVQGDLLLIPPSVMHRAVIVDENALYQRFILTLSEDYCCRLLDGVDGIFTRREVKPMHISLQDEERADVHRMLNQIMEQENDAAGRLAADSLCTLLLLRLQKFAQIQTDSVEDSPVQTQQFIRYINAHYTEQITLEDIAKRFFISKTHLMRQFKKYTHTTVHNYITTKRILLAKALLKENMAPAEVASACGFTTYASFYQAFLLHVGINPRQYANENGGEKLAGIERGCFF